jgi:hypothetical protein
MDKISWALSQMCPLKSTGPDEFASCFSKKYWPIVGV